MGLTERHLKKFHGNRIYSTILLENFPQLCIQIWYFIEQDETDMVAILAFLSSITSIFIAFVDVYSSLSLVMTMKSNEKSGYLYGETFFFDLIGESVSRHKPQFKIRPNAMRKLFAEILEVDKRSVECHGCVSSGDGLQYGFTVYSFNDMYKSTRKLLSHHGSVHPNAVQLQSMEIDSSTMSGTGAGGGAGHASTTSLNSANTIASVSLETTRLYLNNKREKHYSRFDKLMKIYNAIDKNGAFITGIVNIWNLDVLDANEIDVNITNLVTFYELDEGKADTSKYIFNLIEYENDLKSMVATEAYKKNADIFSHDKIGVYQTICIDVIGANLVESDVVNDMQVTATGEPKTRTMKSVSSRRTVKKSMAMLLGIDELSDSDGDTDGEHVIPTTVKKTTTKAPTAPTDGDNNTGDPEINDDKMRDESASNISSSEGFDNGNDDENGNKNDKNNKNENDNETKHGNGNNEEIDDIDEKEFANKSDIYSNTQRYNSRMVAMQNGINMLESAKNQKSASLTWEWKENTSLIDILIRQISGSGSPRSYGSKPGFGRKTSKSNNGDTDQLPATLLPMTIIPSQDEIDADDKPYQNVPVGPISKDPNTDINQENDNEKINVIQKKPSMPL